MFTSEFKRVYFASISSIEFGRGTCQKIESSIDNYLKTIEKLPLALYDSLSNYFPKKSTDAPIVTGMCGSQDVHFHSITSILTSTTNQFLFIGRKMKSKLLPNLRTLFDSTLSSINDHFALFKMQVEIWNNSYQMVKTSSHIYDETRREISIAQSKKNTKKLQSLMEQFRQNQKACSNASNSINTAHIRLCSSVQSSINDLSKISSNFISKLNEILAETMNLVLLSSESFSVLSMQIKSIHLDWTTGFRAFVRQTGIVRTQIPNINPEQHAFSFNDPDLIPATPKKRGNLQDIPLFFATSKKNFIAAGPYEMSVKAGERLLLYETPVGRWCLASKAQGERGYVPIPILDVIRTRTGIAKESRVSMDDYLSTVPGQLFIVSDVQKEYVRCENLNGEKGRVDISNIILE